MTRPHQYTYPHGPPITRQVQEPREGMIIIGLTIRGRKIFRVHVSLPSTPEKGSFEMSHACEAYFRMHIYYEHSNGLHVVCRRVLFKAVVEHGKAESEAVGFNCVVFFFVLSHDHMINPFTPNILFVILPTVCYTNLMMFVWRIWYWIK